MIPSRRIVEAENFRETLDAAGIARGDERLKACEWYLKHDPAHRDSRRVADVSPGEPMFAYRTVATRHRSALLIFYSLRDGGLEVVLRGVMTSVSGPGD